jgi:hypothetical protein
MKPNQEITSGVALLFLVQNLFFPHGVQAQSSGQVLGAVAGSVAQQLPAMFGQTPASPNLNNMNTSLQQQMNACLTAGTLGILTDSKGVVDNVKKWEDALNTKNTSTLTKNASGCSAVCTKPDASLYPEEPVCSTYAYDEYTETVTTARGERSVTKRDPKNGAANKIKSAQDVIGKYITCLNSKKGCKDPKQVELENQLAIFNCQMKVLEAGVQESAKLLNTSIQANQKTFNDMNQHQKEVGEQMQQVDEILGPDPELGKSGSSQMQGLLGMQKELNENLPKMVEAEAKFKTEIETLKNETKTNEQHLEATRVNVASQCIKGSRNVGVSGGYSLSCFKPVQTTSKDGTPVNMTDRNGNIKYAKQSCGPYDYIRSKIEQRAFITERGVMMTESRREKAAANGVAFDSLVDSINREMGDYDAKGADNTRLDTDVHNWSDIESKVSSNIDAVASVSGVDVRSMLRAVAGHCFKEADGWKNKQVRSSSSEYSKKKAEIKKTETNLTAQMDTGLTSMNKTYGDIMSVMFNKHVTLNRTQCTKDNPELMQDCFAKVRQNVQNLLEGNGSLTQTAKTIKGGPSTPPFVVSCRGLNGCVTAFKNVRDSQKTYMRSVQKSKEAYVTQSNKLTQDQLTYFSGNLNTMQNSLMAQYDKIKASLLGMGIDAPEKPKTMEAEMLEATEGPDKSAGPFKSPKNMSSVLSGMMQPAGMINFGDTGMREPLKDLAAKQKEKEAKNAEELAAMKTMQAKYTNIEENCNISLAGSSRDGESSRVATSNYSCNDLRTQLNTCASSMSTVSANNQKKIDAHTKEIERLTKINQEIEKKKNPTAIDQSNHAANLSTIASLTTEISELSSTGTGSSSNTADNIQAIIQSLSSYEEYAKYGDQSGKVTSSAVEFNAYFDPNVAACNDARDRFQACSDHLKSVYTEKHSTSSGSDATYGN